MSRSLVWWGLGVFGISHGVWHYRGLPGGQAVSRSRVWWSLGVFGISHGDWHHRGLPGGQAVSHFCLKWWGLGCFGSSMVFGTIVGSLADKQ